MRDSCVTTASTVIETAARADMMSSEVARAAPRSWVRVRTTLVRASFARGLFITFFFHFIICRDPDSQLPRALLPNCRLRTVVAVVTEMVCLPLALLLPLALVTLLTARTV